MKLDPGRRVYEIQVLRTSQSKEVSAMIIAFRIVVLAFALFSLSVISASAQTRRAGKGGSAQSHARALKDLEAF